MKPFLKQKGFFQLIIQKIQIFFEDFAPQKEQLAPFSTKRKSSKTKPNKINLACFDDFLMYVFSAQIFARKVKADLDSGYGNLSSCTHPEDLDYNTEPWTKNRARGVEKMAPRFCIKPGGLGIKPVRTGGGFTYFLMFSPKNWGRWTQFDEHIIFKWVGTTTQF